MKSIIDNVLLRVIFDKNGKEIKRGTVCRSELYVLDESPCFLVISIVDGKVTYTNLSLSQHFSCTEEEFVTYMYKI
jgi:hypothetical protein